LNEESKSKEEEFKELLNELATLPLISDEGQGIDQILISLYTEFPEQNINSDIIKILDRFLDTEYAKGTSKYIDDIETLLELPKTNGYYTDYYGKRVSYDNIRTLKTANTELKLSLGHQCEIYKCKTSYKYFRSNYCKITTKAGIDRPEPRDYQIRAEDMMLTGKDGLLAFPRQCISHDTELDVDGKMTTAEQLFLECKKESNEIIL